MLLEPTESAVDQDAINVCCILRKDTMDSLERMKWLELLDSYCDLSFSVTEV